VRATAQLRLPHASAVKRRAEICWKIFAGNAPLELTTIAYALRFAGNYALVISTNATAATATSHCLWSP